MDAHFTLPFLRLACLFVALLIPLLSHCCTATISSVPQSKVLTESLWPLSADKCLPLFSQESSFIHKNTPSCFFLFSELNISLSRSLSDPESPK